MHWTHLSLTDASKTQTFKLTLGTEKNPINFKTFGLK